MPGRRKVGFGYGSTRRRESSQCRAASGSVLCMYADVYVLDATKEVQSFRHRRDMAWCGMRVEMGRRFAGLVSMKAANERAQCNEMRSGHALLAREARRLSWERAAATHRDAGNCTLKHAPRAQCKFRNISATFGGSLNIFSRSAVMQWLLSFRGFFFFFFPSQERV
jgi:hypothetical protein